MIEVTAAVIHKDGKFLICQRPNGKDLAQLWEFPGGKIKPNETAEESIIRECQEELGVTINNLIKFDEITYEYPNFTVHIIFFTAEIAYGELIQKEHDRTAWITQQDIGQFEFCPADVEILKRNYEKFKM